MIRRFLARRGEHPAALGPRFEVVAKVRPFEVLSPGFVAAEQQPGPVEGFALGDFSPPAPLSPDEASTVTP